MRDDSSKKEKRKIISLIPWSTSKDLISMECQEVTKSHLIGEIFFFGNLVAIIASGATRGTPAA